MNVNFVIQNVFHVLNKLINVHNGIILNVPITIRTLNLIFSKDKKYLTPSFTCEDDCPDGYFKDLNFICE